jgi:hypothetical protein
MGMHGSGDYVCDFPTKETKQTEPPPSVISVMARQRRSCLGGRLWDSFPGEIEANLQRIAIQ